jgi:hypothetical protein
MVDLRIGALAKLRAEEVAVVDALALEVHRSSQSYERQAPD